eukprot:3410729-Amphidinium_carterae.1
MDKASAGHCRLVLLGRQFGAIAVFCRNSVELRTLVGLYHADSTFNSIRCAQDTLRHQSRMFK